MSRVRRNEWNFAHNAASSITAVLREAEYNGSPMGSAEPELTELNGARRLDLVIFRRNRNLEPLVTGELKVPWAADGRTPYNTRVVENAYTKAATAGALYFITWNIRRIVVWQVDRPGVPLLQRVVYDKEIVPSTLPLQSPADIDNPEVRKALNEGIQELVSFLHSILTGLQQPTYLPLDRVFIARLEASLDYPIARTASALKDQMDASARFRRDVERWMREEGWLVSKSTEAENIERAARFTSYVLVNRLCFYNALRRKYPQMSRLVVTGSINTGERLKQRLNRFFEQAKRFTGNYETVFEGDFGDNIPFITDDTIPAWRELIQSLDHYDFAHIDQDIIGAMYEQLIKPEERHRFGQHYTQPAVVDLINSFALASGDEQVLDPACGGGTFLVRAYARKSYLDPTQDHYQLLEQIYGCDILNYACHLSIINLAVRDLIDDDNFPRVRQGDFLRYAPGSLFQEQPVRIQAGGLPTETRPIVVEPRQFDAIVGNPPYIQAREMS